MQTIHHQLQERVNAALQTVLPDAPSDVSPEALRVVPCANPQFGDYQFNGALPLAKAIKTNPRALAEKIVAQLDVSEISETPEIAGPGFINFCLKREFIEKAAHEAAADSRLGVPLTANPRTIVVDFSAPNVAKPMHVGHIRSTGIGDAISRLLTFAGHKVIRDNHIGDWGTSFGKIIVGWKRELDRANLEADPTGEMERLYKKINAESEADETIAAQARAEIAKLQSGDPENLEIWRQMRDLSQHEFDSIYQRLNVTFDYTLGESFYNDRLNGLVDELKERGIAEESEGAVIIRFTEPKDLADKVVVIQKSDGAATYATTDLATLQYRVQEWSPDEILYVVDARQSLHFREVFATARKWGYANVKLVHISFGTILGDDGTPLKTRAGDTVKLRDVLDEAETRALAIVQAQEKNAALSLDEQQAIARIVGIGAVKYADLSQNRTTDYVFSWDKLLAMQGNTAAYIQYPYVRVCSIFRQAAEQGIEWEELSPTHPSDNAVASPLPSKGRGRGLGLALESPTEIELAKHLLHLPLVIETTLSDYRLNALTDFLFELAQKFTAFYDACPVLKSEGPTRLSRLALCRYTADVLKCGLNLLGIEILEQM